MNLILDLYSALGVDLLTVPATWKELCMVGFQFLGASGFLLWFVKMLYTFAVSVLRGGQ